MTAEISGSKLKFITGMLRPGKNYDAIAGISPFTNPLHHPLPYCPKLGQVFWPLIQPMPPTI